MKKELQRKIALSLGLALCVALSATAQEANEFQAENTQSSWYLGIGGGYRFNKMSYSDLDKDDFPSNKMTGSGIFSIFVNGEFGKNRQFGIRPQVTFLNRGGKLSGIFGNDNAYEENQINNIFYTIKAHYIDLRVPLIFNFGKADVKIRPYVFVAPVFGLCTGGNIKLQADMEDYKYAGYDMDITKANLNSTYFAGQAGIGVKFAIPVADTKCYVGLEAAYEYGFTDTYAGKEKDSKANDILHLYNDDYQIDGNRKFSGIELQATLAIPFDIFKKKPAKTEPKPEPVVQETYTVPAAKPEKPCYTLEEIDEMMAKNKSVDGKTICAIDAITFEFGKSNIKPESYDYLDKLAQTLKRSNRHVEVKGHTDNVGGNEFNMNLSRDRAKAVVDYLVSKGVNPDKLTYSYYGMTRPLSDNDTEEGRAKNRRVEFTIQNN